MMALVTLVMFIVSSGPVIKSDRSVGAMNHVASGG